MGATNFTITGCDLPKDSPPNVPSSPLHAKTASSDVCILYLKQDAAV